MGSLQKISHVRAAVGKFFQKVSMPCIVTAKKQSPLLQDLDGRRKWCIIQRMDIQQFRYETREPIEIQLQIQCYPKEIPAVQIDRQVEIMRREILLTSQ